MPFRAIVLSFLVTLLASPTSRATVSDEPDFGPNVLIFDPSTPDLQKRIDEIFARQEKAQFGDERYALLFKPGKYADLDVQVGFYTHVAGLGRNPDDVDITGAVRVKAKWMKNNNATCNFWRCAENFAVTPTRDNNTNIWATSQAVSLRRVHVKGSLHLWDGGWSSGGFLADSKIDGKIVSGSQQQWLSRNCEWGQWEGGNWNMVFVGCENEPSGEWPTKPYTTVREAPIAREKPYLTIDNDGQYSVIVPALRASNSRGTTWTKSPTSSEAIGIDRFYIARADRDDADSINAALSRGSNVLLTPGIYHLKSAIRVDRPNTIVLGLGYPTLVAENGTPAMAIADVDGVMLSGVLLEAGEKESPTLLQVGESSKTNRSHATNPIFLLDVFARAGGAAAGQTKCFVTINSNDVVGDNFWLWRADHGKGAKWDENKNANGLIVNGDRVTIYGLMVEHTQEYQTVWNGNGGRVYLYQSEMPYDPPNQDAWKLNGTKGYASYKVADNVTTHEAWGVGVYSVFSHAGVLADRAIEAPAAPGVRFHHMIITRLSDKAGSGIAHVINDEGEPVMTKMTSVLTENTRK